MGAIDYVLVVVVFISAVVGLFRGLVKEALSLIVWVIAAWCAWRYGEMLAARLPDFVPAGMLKVWATRAIILVGVLILGGLSTWLLGYLLDRTGLTGTDRMLGMLFGMARGAVLAGLIVGALRLAEFDRDPFWQESKLIPYAAAVADLLEQAADRGMEKLRAERDEA